jgi:hypothetical protein
MARADHVRAGLNIRCAIYTRKSSDEGLDQEFNSLDAQREACEAYIVSQRHAGWVALADMYDDGGLSGGTMERPALKRLLEDIEASKVPIVRRRARTRAGNGRARQSSKSRTAKRKLENGEQRPAPETYPARAEIPENCRPETGARFRATIIPRIIWGENRAQVRSEPEKTVCGGKPLWDSA